jgi:hypothetical protein
VLSSASNFLFKHQRGSSCRASLAKIIRPGTRSATPFRELKSRKFRVGEGTKSGWIAKIGLPREGGINL